MPSGRNCIKFVESAFGSMSHVWESDGFVNSVNSTHDKKFIGGYFSNWDTSAFQLFENERMYNYNLAGSRCLFPPSINCLNCVVIKPIPRTLPSSRGLECRLMGWSNGPIQPIPGSFHSN